MQKEQGRLLIAIGLSFLIFAAWYKLVVAPAYQAQLAAAEAEAETAADPAGTVLSAALPQTPKVLDVDAALNLEPQRIRFGNDKVSGSFALRGGRIDDLTLSNYGIEVDDPTPIRLLAPSRSKRSYFTQTGWLAQNLTVPDDKTPWRRVNNTGGPLGPNNPVTLTWENGAGLTFTRTYQLDEDYLITINERVENTATPSPVTLFPYALAARRGGTYGEERYILHEGPLVYNGEEIEEPDYDDLLDPDEENYQTDLTEGWLGFVDKYWLVSMIPQAPGNISFSAAPTPEDSERLPLFQADWRGKAVTLAAGESHQVTHQFFLGAKEYDVLTDYRDRLGFARFDLALDFGRLYFLTKPFFIVLHTLGKLFGSWGIVVNFGLGILAMTVLVRGATYPLINTSMRSMAKMKRLAPQMKELQQRHKEDKVKLQSELLAMYRREKINPLGSLLPILMTIPIFIALYKVLYIAIDMRHAPFWGWVTDLSVKDPTSVFTLFGLIPINLPAMLTIGAWPVIYGFTMFLQQRLNPKPTDDMQKQIFGMLPLIFTYVMAQLPVGLVIYYAWSNMLGIVQQYAIQKSMGMNPSLLRRPTAESRAAFYRSADEAKDGKETT